MSLSDKPMPGAFVHGSASLPSVTVDAYNLEMKDDEGFIGDRASGRAFRAVLAEHRAMLSELDEDPLGDLDADQISKKKLDKILLEGDPLAAGLVHGTIEDFAQKLAGVARRFLRLKTWRGVRKIVIGGGLRQSRVGELAIGRAALLLKEHRLKVDLVPLRHHPDHAGLIGCAHLAPTGLLHGFDSILALDVGGSNVRCGVVELRIKEASDLSKASVELFDLWRYREDEPKREDLIESVGKMLRKLVDKAERKNLRLAPFLGVGCPGAIEPDGSISAGAQNLPGNWESSKFNLPQELFSRLPTIGEHQTIVAMHNDAVVQGLSEVPAMQDVRQWAVLTIGTGLGNASYTNTSLPSAKKKSKTKPKTSAPLE
jgi:predicted NBD/HSP70 family sugar kinase